MMPQTAAARLTEPLLHPFSVALDAVLSGTPALEVTLVPVVRVAWRLLGLLLAL